MLEPGNRQNTQPRPGEDEAVEAAMLAVVIDGPGEKATLRVGRKRAEAAVAAAYPVIAEAVLAEAAERIEAELTCSCISEAQDGTLWQQAKEAGWPVVRAMGVHQICWWSWSSAELVRSLRSELSGESSPGSQEETP